MRASGVCLLGGESGSIVGRTLVWFEVIDGCASVRTHGKARWDGDVMTALSRAHVWRLKQVSTI
jgi:hypothetical protein